MTKLVSCLAITALALTSILAGCKKDCNDHPGPDPNATMRLASQEYPLMSVTDPNVSGTVTFQKAGNMTRVYIELTGTTAGNMHPAHIHFNSVAEGGGIAVHLNDVNGASGRSTTMVGALSDGTPITYEELLEYDGHVNVHLSASQLSTYIAQGDIGSNF